MKYGDVVLLVIGTSEVSALVLQSLSHPIADKEGNFIKDKDGNFTPACEHLTVAYADPGKGVEVMGGQQVQGAVKFLFSVTPWQEGQHIGFRADRVVCAIFSSAEECNPLQEQLPPSSALPSASDLDTASARKALAEAPADDTRKLAEEHVPATQEAPAHTPTTPEEVHATE